MQAGADFSDFSQGLSNTSWNFPERNGRKSVELELIFRDDPGVSTTPVVKKQFFYLSRTCASMRWLGGFRPQPETLLEHLLAALC